ncbi:D-2-hydroxyacid dehydrogenase [Bradyrhizobium sp. SYSU BS000235]|uniref:D-2-hydroxyacid dehydrogenase n=1 Tax=Bradyrhizobium sp. SYSU BS000235 TaxID=3411332 RepID=UPI003C70F4B3
MLVEPTILFGHVAYQLGDAFKARGNRERYIEVRSIDDVEAKLHDADVLVVSRFWRNEWIERAERLKFVQAVSAGTEQFDRARLAARGIRLASAQGANAGAVAEHAIGLLLSLSRHLHFARDRQREHLWRPMISDPNVREQELSGKTIAIVGLGEIGQRIAVLSKALGMRVIGVNRSGRAPQGIDSIRTIDRLSQILPEVDVVVLACPLTPDTQNLIGGRQLKAMKRNAFLINVSRGRVVDEAALIEALADDIIAGAGLDCFHEEPLPASSPLWDFKNAIITPHSGGETRSYEIRVIDILTENLGRLARGETQLRNQVV